MKNGYELSDYSKSRTMYKYECSLFLFNIYVISRSMVTALSIQVVYTICSKRQVCFTYYLLIQLQLVSISYFYSNK